MGTVERKRSSHQHERNAQEFVPELMVGDTRVKLANKTLAFGRCSSPSGSDTIRSIRQVTMFEYGRCQMKQSRFERETPVNSACNDHRSGRARALRCLNQSGTAQAVRCPESIDNRKLVLQPNRPEGLRPAASMFASWRPEGLPLRCSRLVPLPYLRLGNRTARAVPLL